MELRITVRIPGEDTQLVQQLITAGLPAKLVKGGIAVVLPPHEGGNGTSFDVPPEVHRKIHTLFIEGTEHGGGMTNTGSGTVVCGLAGKALRPYRVFRSGDLSCGTHALFSVPSGFVTVTASRDGSLEIVEHRIRRPGPTAVIESQQLWTGHLDELPNLFAHFSPAAQAAVDKANCYHCRHAHFVRAEE